MKAPAQAILFEGVEKRDAILTGRKTSTVRLGHRNFVPGPVILCDPKLGWAVQALLGKIEWTHVGKAEDPEGVLASVRKYYPSIDRESPISIVHWQLTSVRLHDEAAQRAIDKDHYTTHVEAAVRVLRETCGRLVDHLNGVIDATDLRPSMSMLDDLSAANRLLQRPNTGGHTEIAAADRGSRSIVDAVGDTEQMLRELLSRMIDHLVTEGQNGDGVTDEAYPDLNAALRALGQPVIDEDAADDGMASVREAIRFDVRKDEGPETIAEQINHNRGGH